MVRDKKLWETTSSFLEVGVCPGIWRLMVFLLELFFFFFLILSIVALGIPYPSPDLSGIPNPFLQT